MAEALLRWRLFPREIECGLRAHYSGVSIGMWHVGEMSSREFMVLTDGMPDDSWYKLSAHSLVERVKEDEERSYRMDVQRLIRAQLMGQRVGV